MERNSRWSAVMLVALLSQAMLQVPDCNRNVGTPVPMLSSLEVEAGGIDRLIGFTPATQRYNAWTVGATTLTVRATTSDPTYTLSWSYGGESGMIGVGSGEVTVPEAGGSFFMFVHSEELSRGYEVFINPPCPENLCNDADPCSSDACDVAASTCEFTFLPNGTLCDFSAPGDGVCTSGFCELACGNGTVDPNAGEECDDGTAADTAICDFDCSNAVCGDGYANLAANEDCDEGAINTISCDADCTAPACGDLYVNAAAGEDCDDGNADDNDGCSMCMFAPISCGLDLAACGVNEGCYPNSMGNFCGAPTPDAKAEDEACSSANDCGIGFGCLTRQAGPSVPVCTELCEPSNGFLCSAGGPCSPLANGGSIGACQFDLCDPLDQSACEAGTGCYRTVDASLVTTDICLNEGSTPDGDPCATSTDCFGGSWCVDPGDGNDVCVLLCDPTNGNAGCAPGEVCNPLIDDPTLGGCATAPPFCGNGITDPGEDCDDSGQSAGCDADCTFAACGDGTVNVMAGEACDDGNTVDGDGCSATCQITPVACTTLEAVECAVGEACYPTGSGALCSIPGAVAEGGTCTNMEECGAGFGCVSRLFGSPGSVCTELCDATHACTAGGPCSSLGSPSGIGVCDPSACDLLDVTTCGSGLGCYSAIYDGVPYDLCITEGTTAVGGTCSESTDCVAGAQCVTISAGVNQCLARCDPVDGVPGCDLGAGESCLELNPTLGVCFAP